MDPKEEMEKLKKYQADFESYLKAKYFSGTDFYGDEVVDEKEGGAAGASRTEAIIKSYADPVGYLKEKEKKKEKEKEKEEEEEKAGSSKPAVEKASEASVAEGKQPAPEKEE